MQRIGRCAVLALVLAIFAGLSWMGSVAAAETASVHMERGNAHYESGDYESALKEFRAATQVDPGYLEGWENTGWAYWKMGRIDRTLEIWRNLKAAHPDRCRLLNMSVRIRRAGRRVLTGVHKQGSPYLGERRCCLLTTIGQLSSSGGGWSSRSGEP